MRYEILNEEDFFQVGEKRLTMDPTGVELPDIVPIAYQFNWEMPPYGRVINLRLEGNVISGEARWREEIWGDSSMEEFGARLGGYYGDTKVLGGIEIIRAKLLGVGIIMPPEYVRSEEG